MKIILAALVALSLLQDKAYEPKFKATPVAGSKNEFSQDQTQSIKMVASAGEQKLQDIDKAESYVFSGVDEIVKVNGKETLESKRTFTKAVSRAEGKETPLSIQGKTITVIWNEDRTKSFKDAEGKDLDAGAAEEARKSFPGSERPRANGEPSAEELFTPTKPVKVGESWTPDIAKLAQMMMGGDESAKADMEKSKATLTLKSVETRDGVEFGKVHGDVELVVTAKMGPMTLDKPVVIKLSLDLDACIDGSRPDGSMTMKMDMGLDSDGNAEGQKMHILMDSHGTMTESRKSVR